MKHQAPAARRPVTIATAMIKRRPLRARAYIGRAFAAPNLGPPALASGSGLQGARMKAARRKISSTSCSSGESIYHRHSRAPKRLRAAHLNVSGAGAGAAGIISRRQPAVHYAAATASNRFYGLADNNDDDDGQFSESNSTEVDVPKMTTRSQVALETCRQRLRLLRHSISMDPEDDDGDDEDDDDDEEEDEHGQEDIGEDTQSEESTNTADCIESRQLSATTLLSSLLSRRADDDNKATDAILSRTSAPTTATNNDSNHQRESNVNRQQQQLLRNAPDSLSSKASASSSQCSSPHFRSASSCSSNVSVGIGVGNNNNSDNKNGSSRFSLRALKALISRNKSFMGAGRNHHLRRRKSNSARCNGDQADLINNKSNIDNNISESRYDSGNYFSESTRFAHCCTTAPIPGTDEWRLIIAMRLYVYKYM